MIRGVILHVEQPQPKNIHISHSNIATVLSIPARRSKTTVTVYLVLQFTAVCVCVCTESASSVIHDSSKHKMRSGEGDEIKAMTSSEGFK